MKKRTLIAGLIMTGILATACSGGAPGDMEGDERSRADMAGSDSVVEAAPSDREGGERQRGGMTGSDAVVEAVPVETMTLEKNTIMEEVYTFGYLEPNDSYYVTPYSSGIVDEIFVSEGDYVEVGQILYQLETSDLDLSQDKDMLNSQSSITSAKNSLDSLEITLNQREADLETAELNLEIAKEDYETTLELFNNGISSQSELDSAKDFYAQAEISYEQAVLNYDSTALSYSQAQTSYNEAVRSNSLTVTDYDDRRDDYYVTTPISGLVTEVSVQTELMNQGTSGITIIDDATMLLNVNIMEKYIYEIEEGQSVRLILDYLDDEIVGTVTDISLVSNKGYYPVEISIDNSDKILKSGMYSEGYISVNSKDNVLVIDKNIIMTDIYDVDYVFVIKDDSETATRVDVTRGIESGNQVEVSGELSVGDKIVVVGQNYLADGQLVMNSN